LGKPLHFPIPISAADDDFHFKAPYIQVKPLTKPGLDQQQEVHQRPHPLDLIIEPMPLQSFDFYYY